MKRKDSNRDGILAIRGKPQLLQTSENILYTWNIKLNNQGGHKPGKLREFEKIVKISRKTLGNLNF